MMPSDAVCQNSADGPGKHLCRMLRARGRVIDTTRSIVKVRLKSIGHPKPILEFKGVLAQVVPPSEQPSPTRGPEGIRKFLCPVKTEFLIAFRDVAKVFFEWFPFRLRATLKAVREIHRNDLVL